MRPHDISDLSLAPVALSVDARLDELGALSASDLAAHVALVSDSPNTSQEMRRSSALQAVGHLIDLHGWELSWDPRGVRVRHDEYQLVLGVPQTLYEFVSEGRDSS